MKHSLFVALLLLAAGTGSASAEAICNIDDRWEYLADGEVLTVSGRIVESYGRDSDGNYSYEVEDHCGIAYIGRDRPINCDRVTVTGNYDEFVSFESFGQVAIWVTRVTCN